MVNRYTMKDFRTEEACLKMVFYNRFGRLYTCPKCNKRGHFNLIISRKRFDCQCGYGIYPLAGTIFHGSATPLRLWFYAIYLFASSQNGVAAKELERQLGVTYKTAWRISKQIRLIFSQQGSLLSTGIDDDIYVRLSSQRHASRPSTAPKTTLFTFNQPRRDRITGIASHDYLQEIIKNKIQEYISRQANQTYEIDRIWPQIKTSLDETHRIISPKYLQLYVDEVIYRHKHRYSPNHLFAVMLQQAVKQSPS